MHSVVLGLGLGLEQKSLALAKQVLGLAGLVICQTNNTATMLTRKPCYRKDDRAMRPIYGCPEKCSRVLANAPGYFSRNL